MRSSTSSSESPEFKRSVPGGAWPRSAIVAVVLLLLATTAWELHVRGEGYAPCRNDSSDLWARTRAEVSDDPNQLVVIGSSRILFDLDLQTCLDSLAVTSVVQLAMPGTSPLQLLEDLATEEDFQGTLLLGATPGLWFVPEGSPVERARQAVGRYRNWSPSQRAGLEIAEELQTRLAFINAEDLTLPVMLGAVSVPNRPGAAVNLPPRTPPYFAWPDARRQNRMWEKCDFDTPLATRIQQIWLPLFTPPPPPPHLTEEEFGAMMAANSQSILDRIAAATATLRARGVRIVWVRPPSSGELRGLERKFGPRAGLWDRMLAVSGSPGIHFEDYPELAGFTCPEWSHLTARDAVLFTRALMPLVRGALAGA